MTHLLLMHCLPSCFLLVYSTSLRYGNVPHVTHKLCQVMLLGWHSVPMQASPDCSTSSIASVTGIWANHRAAGHLQGDRAITGPQGHRTITGKSQGHRAIAGPQPIAAHVDAVAVAVDAVLLLCLLCSAQHSNSTASTATATASTATAKQQQLDLYYKRGFKTHPLSNALPFVEIVSPLVLVKRSGQTHFD